MKKTSPVNLIIIIGLLALCVMALVAVYAIAPESSTVLLLEDNFNVLDGTKWMQQISECTSNGDELHYLMTDNNNGNIEDGIIQIRPELIVGEGNYRSKREASQNCRECLNIEESDTDCLLSVYSVKLKTINLIDANKGRLEIRAKFPAGNWTKTSIGIIPNSTDLDGKEFNILEVTGEETTNGYMDLKVSFGSPFNRTTAKSLLTRNDFHIYTVEWKDDQITFKVDNKHISKNTSDDGFEMREIISNATEVFNNNNSMSNSSNTLAFNQPFYLSIGVNVGKQGFQNASFDTENKKSLSHSTDHNKNKSTHENILEMDYVRLFKILN